MVCILSNLTQDIYIYIYIIFLLNNNCKINIYIDTQTLTDKVRKLSIQKYTVQI